MRDPVDHVALREHALRVRLDRERLHKRIIELRQQDLPNWVIAERLGVTHMTIKNVLKKAGLAPVKNWDADLMGVPA